MVFRDLQQLCELEDKDCFFERKWKPSEFIISCNTYPGTPGFFLAPSWETCLLSSLMFPHLWLKLLLSKTAFSSPTQIKCIKSQALTQWSQGPCTSTKTPLWLSEVQEKAKGAPGWVLTQQAGCRQPKPPATEAGPAAAAGADREHTAGNKLSLWTGPDSKSLTATGFNRLWMEPQHAEETGRPRGFGRTNINPGNSSTVHSYKIMPSHNIHSCKCFWPQGWTYPLLH